MGNSHPPGSTPESGGVASPPYVPVPGHPEISAQLTAIEKKLDRLLRLLNAG